MAIVYKICERQAWLDAEAAGNFAGSAVDFADGFIHLSAADQVRETARRHFRTGDDLVLIAFDDSDIAGLRYEPSRDGALFPHVYGALETRLARRIDPLPRDHGGLLVFPSDVPGDPS